MVDEQEEDEVQVCTRRDASNKGTRRVPDLSCDFHFFIRLCSSDFLDPTFNDPTVTWEVRLSHDSSDLRMCGPTFVGPTVA